LQFTCCALSSGKERAKVRSITAGGQDSNKTGEVLNGAGTKRWEDVMKARLFGMLSLSGLALTATMLMAPVCKAQSEVNPDHFDGTEPWVTAVQKPPVAEQVASAARTTRTESQKGLVANIPFAFTAESKTLPAGEYRVQKAAYHSPALLIQRTDGSAATLVTSFAPMKASQAQSKLVFDRDGEGYVLSQVCILGSAHGRKLPKSTEEKDPALAKQSEKPEQVVIVARLIPSQP
jgi:hypothetical protein